MAKFIKRCLLVMLSLYVVILILSYRFMPRGDSRDLRNNAKSGQLQDLITVDPYQLRWDKKGKVFYKKVRDGVNQAEIRLTNDVFDEKRQSCDPSYRNTEHFTEIENDLFLFSSYLDNRTGKPVVRSIGMYKANSSFDDHKLFTCHFKTRTSGKNQLYVPSKAKFYEMCESHGKRYAGYIISCPLPSHKDWLLNSLRIGRGVTTKESLYNSKPVCITARDKNVVRRKMNFGVCVSPLHGFVKPKDLVEFIEVHRLLGADMFTFYLEALNSTVANEILGILRHYRAKNIVNLVTWDLPIDKRSIWYHGQSLAMNDCLYRNMADFRYIAFIDIDEVLVPNGPELTSWLDLIQHLKADMMDFESYSGFSFRSAFFDESFSTKVFSSELKTVILTNRTKSFSIFRNKLLVRPERVFEIGIHHISKSWPEEVGYSVYAVETDVARIHHYRTCIREFGIHCKSRVADNVLTRKFGNAIKDNYYKTLYDILP